MKCGERTVTNGSARPMTVSSLITSGVVAIGISSMMLANACLGETGAEILEAAGVTGGLVVHLGCGDGQLTAELGAPKTFIVQGLDADRSNVDKARATIRRAGSYGKTSAASFDGRSLPYADGLVNLVVGTDLGSVTMDEVLRVLCPNGVAMIRENGTWKTTIKPRPAEIDEWTHYLYDAGNNAVSHDDQVGPPNSLQWAAPPRWSRHHDHMSSISAVVSSGGRVFYIVDEGPTSAVQLPADWKLVARDAFNGTLLWKRSIPEWHTNIWPAKAGPAQLPRRLVAVGDKVYVTLGIEAPVSVLDAATGQTLTTHQGTELAEELILDDGLLLVMTNANPLDRPRFTLDTVRCWTESRRAKESTDWRWERDRDRKKILAIEEATGKMLWQCEDSIAPITMTAIDQYVLYHNGVHTVCRDRRTGQKLWESEHIANIEAIPTHTAPNLVAYEDVVLFSAGPGTVVSMSIEDGKTLWSDKHGPSGHQSTFDLLVANGLVWSNVGTNVRKSKQSRGFVRKKPWTYAGRDPVTGETKVEFPPDSDAFWFHHRCHRGRATDNYLLMSRTGIEYIDIHADVGHWMPHHWIRGACIYGIMPANGLTYAPPHSCACYIESKLNGFNAVTSQRSTKIFKPVEADRLEKGSAYGRITAASSMAPSADSWPMYRHDAIRSGSTKTNVPAHVKPVWTVEPGGRLSSPVIAGGKVFVARVDEHAILALDASSGDTIWSYTAGGRVDSPPVISRGMIYFGSADGWIYCLRESDGELVWRYRGVAEERHIVSYDQLESAWPVHGSVLIQDGSIYCVAGRSMFLDGGLHLLKLDMLTGEKQFERVLDENVPDTEQSLQSRMVSLDMPVAMADILSSDGKHLYMRSQSFTLDGHRPDVPVTGPTDQGGEQAHLVCPSGFLDDAWHHRSYWVFGRGYGTGHNGWFRAGRFAPAGRMLVFDEDTVYGYGRQPEMYVWSTALEYQLFAAQRQVQQAAIDRTAQANRRQESPSEHGHEITFDRELMRRYSLREISAIDFRWRQKDPSIQARAMVLADETLFVAGLPDVVDEEDIFSRPYDPTILAKGAEQVAALNGERGAVLLAVSASDGKRLFELKLDGLPVFDGLAAAHGMLFMSTVDGTVCCFGK